MSDLKLEGALDLVSDLVKPGTEATHGVWTLPSFEFLEMHGLRPDDLQLQAKVLPLLEASDSFGVIDTWARGSGCDYPTVKLLWGSAPTRSHARWLRQDFKCPRPDTAQGIAFTLYQAERDPVKRMALQYIYYARAERLLRPAPDLRSWYVTCNLLNGWETDQHPRQYLRSLLVPTPLTQREFDRLIGVPITRRDFPSLRRVVNTLAKSPDYSLPYVIKMLEDDPT